VRFPADEARMLWFCQSVALAISAIVAPFGGARGPGDVLFRETSRGTFGLFTLAAFLLATSPGLLLRRGLGFAWRLSSRHCGLGAPFFWLAAFFEAAFSGATCGALFRNGGGFGVLVASAFFMVVFILLAVDPRMTIHHSGGPEGKGFSGKNAMPAMSQRAYAPPIVESRCRCAEGD